MTYQYSYEWFCLPPKLSIICPSCEKEAFFQFALVQHIQGRKFQEYYKNHPAFETMYLYDAYAYVHKFCAILYPTFHLDFEQILSDIPEQHKNFSQRTPYLNKSYGAVTCIHCLIKRKHQLLWPEEAYYCIEYKGHVLWAPNLSIFQSIHDYIASKDRDRHKYGHYHSLLHLPQHFLTQNARTTVIKKIQTFLATHNTKIPLA